MCLGVEGIPKKVLRSRPRFQWIFLENTIRDLSMLMTRGRAELLSAIFHDRKLVNGGPTKHKQIVCEEKVGERGPMFG